MEEKNKIMETRKDHNHCRLEKEEKVGVLLEFTFIGKMSLGSIDILKMSFDLVLLGSVSGKLDVGKTLGCVLHQEPCGSG